MKSLLLPLTAIVIMVAVLWAIAPEIRPQIQLVVFVVVTLAAMVWVARTLQKM
ncbi:hypothetical protein HY971_01545 [Candidatus Kaiserbacteria bacterium]|nr:hypothetical protein [Candidatus Kaiserbacteria bacterium]